MTVNDIKNVTCYGAGMIGSSWALNFAMEGLAVKLFDINDAAVEAGMNRIKQGLEGFKRNGVLTDGQIQEILGRIQCTTDPVEALKDADYIQESGPENFPAKHGIVDLVEKHAPVTAIYASSTSYMNVSDICKPAVHKERYIGAHPYNPPHLIPLVELTKTDDTDPAVLQLAYDFFKAIHKEPVVLMKESLGFISNRIQSVLGREMNDLIYRGVCTAEDANKAITFGPAMRWAVMGPHMVFELGSATGYRGLHANISGSGINVLDDVAKWTKTPDEVYEMIFDGIDRMKETDPEYKGKTNAELADWRDDMLIGILKLHHKL